ncbi:protein ANTAGONIST OF LIKE HETEROCHROMATIN PROTEIN 1 [Folsomia candida]|uniref:Putative nuclease HARBI1 n=1 Tax=Folsomia candida TaxID=158441 RepID=A0A226D2P5_FOLCA|nr:protein ANTAGONIST OF LIKE HETEROCHROMATIN PROTEIN 1 [Folsomia candida]OXA39154.1 putative nuclease HARBI1 [Folsomia candida]
MTPPQFDTILGIVREDLQKQDTNYRASIPPEFRLFVTLRYLATGDSLAGISTSYSMGHTTVWRIVRETTQILWNRLSPIFVKAPTSEDFNLIERGFRELWNFPNCVGAVDGKHVDIEAPYKSESQYYNYKGRFSIVLMASCDADYRFTTVDVGAYGRQSDAGVFSISALGTRLESGRLGIPGPKLLPNSIKQLPCAFVGDEAFPLKCYMMRPARRIIENAFGVMSKRFRIFRRPIVAQPQHVESIIKACIALHNFLRTQDLSAPSLDPYCPAGFVDTGDEDNGEWRQEEHSLALRNLTRLSSNMHSAAAREMRDSFAEYFVNEGAVEWRRNLIGLD